jgi:hypothetical protein
LTLALGFFSFSVSAQKVARSRSGSAALSVDARSSFFPLAAGNSWTYTVDRLGPEDGVTVEVGDPVDISGVSYFPVSGLAGADVLLRSDSRGRIVEYKRDQGREALWWDFAAPIGGTWTPEFPDGCTGPATVAERNALAGVPAGKFAETIRIEYGPGDCADAGVGEETFAAGVGLVSRTETTIAGPRTMQLVRARVSGRTVEGTGLSFSVRVDRPVYTPNLQPPVYPEKAIPVLKATVTVENSSGVPVTITFPSTQLFDLAIHDAAGETVYTWSADKLFAAVITEVELGRRVFEAEIPLAVGASPLRPGMYVLEAWLVKPDGKAFSGSVGFEVTEAAQ